MENKPDYMFIDNPGEVTTKGLFTLKPVNQWIDEAKHQANPIKLFDDFWEENEVCIMFSDANIGKTILAVQIADCISSGKRLDFFNCGTWPQPVLYFDFEMSAKQVENRYSDNFTDHYRFSDDFIRVVITNPEYAPDNMSFEDYLKQEMCRAVEVTNSKVVIVDNITYLNSGTESAKDALPLMKWIKGFANQYKLSVLILAHTPKRKQSCPIGMNDLQGSKMLMNFCDSCFAIGSSIRGTDYRYLKQIKHRAGIKKYDSDNVVVCRVCKNHNFVGFVFDSTGNEKDHLTSYTDDGWGEELKDRVKELSNAGLSQREIGKEVNVAVSTVNKYLHKE